MKHNFSIIITILVVVSLAAPAAAAPTTTAPPSSTPDAPDQPTDPEATIDNATTLVSSSLDLQSETVTLTIRSEIPQKVVITDSGDYVRGGEVDQRSIYLRPGQTATIKMPITVVDQGIGNQFAGVSITTAKTLYAVPLETSSPLIGGPWTYRDAQIVGLTMAITASITIVLIILRGKYDLDANPERVA